MAISAFSAALNQLADERGLPRDIIVEAMESAVGAAYRKDYGEPEQEISSKFDEESGSFKVFQVFDVVEEVENTHAQVTVDDAQEMKKGAKLEDKIEIELEPHTDFGRIAAQTAKQVISQRLREAEKEILYIEYKEKQGQLINGYVQQVEGPNVIMNIGRLNGLMIASDQIPGQHYFPGQRLKILVYTVEETPRGPRVLVTRSSTEFIKKLFELEVPEIASESVEIKDIAREAGTRTKMAVISNQPGLDPVGSCVGQRGSRVQAVLSELGDEKIDIIPWKEDTAAYLIEALKPAEVEKVKLLKKYKRISLTVADDQLSLAIGKNGQNVRLASKLLGWEVDIIKKEGQEAPKKASTEKDRSNSAVTSKDKKPISEKEQVVEEVKVKDSEDSPMPSDQAIDKQTSQDQADEQEQIADEAND